MRSQSLISFNLLAWFQQLLFSFFLEEIHEERREAENTSKGSEKEGEEEERVMEGKGRQEGERKERPPPSDALAYSAPPDVRATRVPALVSGEARHVSPKTSRSFPCNFLRLMLGTLRDCAHCLARIGEGLGDRRGFSDMPDIHICHFIFDKS